MIDAGRLDRELEDYLVANALGRRNVKTKDEVIDALHVRGVFGMGVARVHAVRVLCDARVRLIARDVPIGPCNDGWFIAVTQEELAEVKNRERARAMAVLDGIKEFERAYYTFAARRLGSGMAGKQEALR